MPGPDRLKPKLASALSPPVEMVQNPAPGMEQLKPLPPPIVKNQGPTSQVKDTKPHATSDLVNSQSPMSQVSPLQSTSMPDTTAVSQQPVAGEVLPQGKDTVAPLAGAVPPPPPNPFLLDDIDETQAARTSKRSMESMGSHHSGLFHDYVYNPRLEVKESRVQDKVYSSSDTNKSATVIAESMSQANGRATPSDTFQNGYVYYENGIPVLMQEERIPEAKEIKRPTRPHSTNTVHPPVLDGWH